MTRVFKMKMPDGSKSVHYFGKIKQGPKRWKRVKLFTDKLSSERRLKDLQIEADQWSTGVRNVTTAEGMRPIDQHVDEYLASLKLRASSADHHSIASNMLRRLVKQAAWKFIRDISLESVERAVAELAGTESYQNCFIKRAKAFGAWLEDQGRVTLHPLRKLRRVSEKNATRTRARRAANAAESAALFALPMPDDRRLAYALGRFNGLRRNEIKTLTWDRVRMTATIPFIEVAQKNGTGGALDSIPLHPYCVTLLNQRTAGMPGVKIVRFVPDVSTLESDLTRAKVQFVDPATKRRLDFHALRHTFQTDLDLTGCSRATKKRLMRHAAGDVTDGYAHAELSEMLAALSKLQSPELQPVLQVATGTDGTMLAGTKGPLIGPRPDPSHTSKVSDMRDGTESTTAVSTRKNRANVIDRQPLSFNGLMFNESGDILLESRPDTQVD